MTQEQYISKLLELTNEFELKKKELAKEYALSNNPHKIGDVIGDTEGKIRIEKINGGFSWGETLPGCIYYGIVLKKDLTPTKREERRNIYQKYIQP